MSLRPHGLWPPRPSVHGIPQTRMLEWVAISFSRASSRPRDRTPTRQADSFTAEPLCTFLRQKAIAHCAAIIILHTLRNQKKCVIHFIVIFVLCAKLLQSCLTLCSPSNCSLPGSSVHGILQARTLDWVAIPLSRGCSRLRE